jgi:UDP-2,4-diacetamido-2,4,6-trideoxy-beta-L-altropyranose hydrolase
MNVAMRCDAGGVIGVGHLMRCLTLAAALREGGARVRVVTRRLPAYLRDLITDQGVELRGVGGGGGPPPAGDLCHSGWLGTTQEHDADETIAALADVHWDWLVVDHYALDARWQRRLRLRADRILAVDDLADRVHDADILLDQNLVDGWEARYHGRVPAGCTTLLGPGYALLRREFTSRRRRQAKRDGRVAHVLVMLGGSNQYGEVDAAMDAVASCGLAAEVVIGADVRGRVAVEDRCRTAGFRCHVQPGDVVDLMVAADLSIGATGGTSWERCCLALPAICVTSAANQVPIARGLERAGAIRYLGEAGGVTAAELHASIRQLMDRPHEVRAMADAAASLVDGCGADRVVGAMLEAM